MAAAIDTDRPVSALDEKQHLRVPVIGAQWPAMVKDDRRSLSPVLVEDLGSVPGLDVGHVGLLLLAIFRFQRRGGHLAATQKKDCILSIMQPCSRPKQLHRAANRSRCVTGGVSCAIFGGNRMRTPGLSQGPYV